MSRLNSFLNNLKTTFLIFPLLARWFSQGKLNRYLCTSRFFLFHISHLTYAEYKDQLLTPTVTSKYLSQSFFIYSSVLLKRGDFLELVMVFVS